MPAGLIAQFPYIELKDRNAGCFERAQPGLRQRNLKRFASGGRREKLQLRCRRS
jgi:hypothetical protein